MRAGAFLLGLCAVASACGGDEPSDPCVGLMPTVTLTSGQPVFEWSAECPANALDVSPSDNTQSFVWVVLADPGDNSILGPVTYGVAPPGTGVTLPATPLVSGQDYQLHLRRAADPFGVELELMGSADFTAP
jgi:hypothetical protein